MAPPRVLLRLFALALSACSAGKPPPPSSLERESGEGSVPTSGSTSPARAEGTSGAADAGGATPPTAGTERAGAEARSEPSPAFPPKDIAPPHPRSAEEGDGRWVPLVSPAQDAPAGPLSAALVKTVIHPHEASRFIELTLVAVDLGRVSLHFMPGKEDVGSMKVAFSPGLVPAAERDRLLGVFNGGFQPRHGRWGMVLGEATILPPRDPGCTVAIRADGAVRLRSWPALAPDAASFRAVRQTPPCLVEQGEIHPHLFANRDAEWKGRTPGIVTRRRSAIGLDRSGMVLFYALGVEASPRLIAEGMRHAGAHDAAQLDINWNWTRFLFYGNDASGKPRVTGTLAPGEYAKSGYVERPSERDFFYLLSK